LAAFGLNLLPDFSPTSLLQSFADLPQPVSRFQAFQFRLEFFAVVLKEYPFEVIDFPFAHGAVEQAQQGELRFVEAGGTGLSSWLRQGTDFGVVVEPIQARRPEPVSLLFHTDVHRKNAAQMSAESIL
jgi:hypothetical protein